MSHHKILKLPDYWVNEETNTLFNDFGFQGWELLRVYNQHAYFMKHQCPIKYKFMKNDQYVTDMQNSLNTLGFDNWIFVLNVNGYSILKQIQIQ